MTVLEQAFYQATSRLLSKLKQYQIAPKEFKTGEELIGRLVELNTEIETIKSLLDEYQHKQELEKRIN